MDADTTSSNFYKARQLFESKLAELEKPDDYKKKYLEICKEICAGISEGTNRIIELFLEMK